MTHAEVVERARRWLLGAGRCGLVLTEFQCWTNEIPDAIGWTGGAHNSILIECKTSRSDFYADKTKPGRHGKLAHMGIGRERYYMAPRGVLSADLVARHQPAWGLLEITGRVVRVSKKAIPYGHEARARELPLMYSALRRLIASGAIPNASIEIKGSGVVRPTQ